MTMLHPSSEDRASRGLVVLCLTVGAALVVFSFVAVGVGLAIAELAR